MYGYMCKVIDDFFPFLLLSSVVFFISARNARKRISQIVHPFWALTLPSAKEDESKEINAFGKGLAWP